MAEKKKNATKRGVLTPIGTLSFPFVHRETARDKKDDKGNPTGKKSYEVQLLIPKSDRAGVRKLMAAINEVGREQWGDKWGKSPSLRNPLRDGDAEADELTSDGMSTKGEKYPERAGHYYISARSERPIGVIDRDKNIIDEPSEIYAGAKGRINVDLFAYSNKSHGVGVGLNGLQKVAEGEPLTGDSDSVKDVNTMFDDISDEDIDALEDEVEEAPATKKKPVAKKTAAKPKTKAKPVVEEEDEDLLDDDDDLDEDDDI